MASCTQNRKHSLLSALSAHWQEQADQIRLELSDVDVEGAVEAERRRQGRDHLRQEAVKVRVRRPLDVQVPAADIVEGFVVDLVRDVSVPVFVQNLY